MVTTTRLNKHRGYQRDKGMALVAVVILLIGLTITLSAFSMRIVQEKAMTKRYVTYVRSYYIAEAGIKMAKGQLVANFLASPDDYSLDKVFLGPDGIEGSEDDGVLQFGPNMEFDNGNFAVRVVDNDDGDGDFFADNDRRVVIRSTGTAIDGTKRTLEIQMEFPANLNVPADLKTSGDVTVINNKELVDLLESQFLEKRFREI